MSTIVTPFNCDVGGNGDDCDGGSSMISAAIRAAIATPPTAANGRTNPTWINNMNSAGNNAEVNDDTEDDDDDDDDDPVDIDNRLKTHTNTSKEQSLFSATSFSAWSVPPSSSFPCAPSTLTPNGTASTASTAANSSKMNTESAKLPVREERGAMAMNHASWWRNEALDWSHVVSLSCLLNQQFEQQKTSLAQQAQQQQPQDGTPVECPPTSTVDILLMNTRIALERAAEAIHFPDVEPRTIALMHHDDDTFSPVLTLGDTSRATMMDWYEQCDLTWNVEPLRVTLPLCVSFDAIQEDAPIDCRAKQWYVHGWLPRRIMQRLMEQEMDAARKVFAKLSAPKHVIPMPVMPEHNCFFDAHDQMPPTFPSPPPFQQSIRKDPDVTPGKLPGPFHISSHAPGADKKFAFTDDNGVLHVDYGGAEIEDAEDEEGIESTKGVKGMLSDALSISKELEKWRSSSSSSYHNPSAPTVAKKPFVLKHGVKVPANLVWYTDVDLCSKCQDHQRKQARLSSSASSTSSSSSSSFRSTCFADAAPVSKSSSFALPFEEWRGAHDDEQRGEEHTGANDGCRVVCYNQDYDVLCPSFGSNCAPASGETMDVIVPRKEPIKDASSTKLVVIWHYPSLRTLVLANPSNKEVELLSTHPYYGFGEMFTATTGCAEVCDIIESNLQRGRFESVQHLNEVLLSVSFQIKAIVRQMEDNYTTFQEQDKIERHIRKHYLVMHKPAYTAKVSDVCDDLCAAFHIVDKETKVAFRARAVSFLTNHMRLPQSRICFQMHFVGIRRLQNGNANQKHVEQMSLEEKMKAREDSISKMHTEMDEWMRSETYAHRVREMDVEKQFFTKYNPTSGAAGAVHSSESMHLGWSRCLPLQSSSSTSSSTASASSSSSYTKHKAKSNSKAKSNFKAKSKAV